MRFFLSPSDTADNYAGYISLDLSSWSFITWNTFFKVAIEKLSVIGVCFPLYKWLLFSYIFHYICFVLYSQSFNYLMTWGFSFSICIIYFKFCLCLLSVYITLFWENLKILSMSLTWDSSASSILIIWRFDLFIVFHISCMFLTYCTCHVLIFILFSYFIQRVYLKVSVLYLLLYSFYLKVLTLSVLVHLLCYLNSFSISDQVLLNVSLSSLNSPLKPWILLIIFICLMFVFS